MLLIAAQVEIHPNVPELYRRKAFALTDLLNDYETCPEDMDMIRNLV